MPEQIPEEHLYRRLYWVFQNIEGAKHPEYLDWEVSDDLRSEMRREVQKGWSPHDGPIDPMGCDHPGTARSFPFTGKDDYGIRYAVCDRCGTTVHPYAQGPDADEEPFICKN